MLLCEDTKRPKYGHLYPPNAKTNDLLNFLHFCLVILYSFMTGLCRQCDAVLNSCGQSHVSVDQMNLSIS